MRGVVVIEASTPPQPQLYLEYIGEMGLRQYEVQYEGCSCEASTPPHPQLDLENIGERGLRKHQAQYKSVVIYHLHLQTPSWT